MKINSLQDYKDQIAIASFGITTKEAHKLCICIRCKKLPRFKTDSGEQEYMISALCEYCFEDIVKEKD